MAQSTSETLPHLGRVSFHRSTWACHDTTWPLDIRILLANVVFIHRSTLSTRFHRLQRRPEFQGRHHLWNGKFGRPMGHHAIQRAWQPNEPSFSGREDDWLRRTTFWKGFLLLLPVITLSLTIVNSIGVASIGLILRKHDTKSLSREGKSHKGNNTKMPFIRMSGKNDYR